MDYPEWFFAWKTGIPFITKICGWSKREAIQEAEESNSQVWKQIYSRGGRIVKVKISICKNKTSKRKPTNGK